MQIDIFSKNLRALMKQRNYSFCLNIFFGLIIIILLIITLKKSNLHTTVVVPANFNSPVTITQSGVDVAFLSQWTEFIASLKLNITPDTVGYKQKTLLAYVDSSKYGEIKSYLINEQEAIKNQEMSMAFFPKNTEVLDIDNLKVKISGLLRIFIGDELNKELDVSYEISYRKDSGRLMLFGFREV